MVETTGFEPAPDTWQESMLPVTTRPQHGSEVRFILVVENNDSQQLWIKVEVKSKTDLELTKSVLLPSIRWESIAYLYVL